MNNREVGWGCRWLGARARARTGARTMVMLRELNEITHIHISPSNTSVTNLKTTILSRD